FEIWLAADLRHEEAYDRAITLWAALDTLERGDIDADLLEPRAQPTLWPPQVLEPRRARSGWTIAVAAMLLILALPALYIGVSWSRDATFAAGVDFAAHSTEIGEVRQITLEDGTRITLGPRTTLDAGFSATERWVVLKDGAALLHIATDADRPFSVRLGGLTATALGTVFETRRGGGVSRVAVAEGRVAVRKTWLVFGWPLLGLEDRETLAVGDRVAAVEDLGLERLNPVDPAAIGAWRDRRLVYDGAPLRELIADVNRYVDQPVLLAEGDAGLAELTVTAAFQGDEIDALLSTLPRILPVAVERHPDGRVVISGQALSAE
ncbi:MAG: FecR domain-containing protein, partial [Pseudomonadota bacterium]